MSFCNFLLASVLHVGLFRKPVGLRDGLARPPVIHTLNKFIINFYFLFQKYQFITTNKFLYKHKNIKLK
jgi:hypothetical protein